MLSVNVALRSSLGKEYLVFLERKERLVEVMFDFMYRLDLGSCIIHYSKTRENSDSQLVDL